MGAIGGRARLGVNQVVPGANQKAKVGCGLFKLELLFGRLEPLHEVEERVGNAAGRTILEAVYTSRLDALAAPNGVPFQACKGENSQSDRTGIIRVDRHSPVTIVHVDFRCWSTVAFAIRIRRSRALMQGRTRRAAPQPPPALADRYC